eukprot:jgi/Botrbrau1/15575/Bobra.33_1s0004.1
MVSLPFLLGFEAGQKNWWAVIHFTSFPFHFHLLTSSSMGPLPPPLFPVLYPSHLPQPTSLYLPPLLPSSFSLTPSLYPILPPCRPVGSSRPSAPVLPPPSLPSLTPSTRPYCFSSVWQAYLIKNAETLQSATVTSYVGHWLILGNLAKAASRHIESPQDAAAETDSKGLARSPPHFELWLL